MLEVRPCAPKESEGRAKTEREEPGHEREHRERKQNVVLEVGPCAPKESRNRAKEEGEEHGDEREQQEHKQGVVREVGQRAPKENTSKAKLQEPFKGKKLRQQKATSDRTRRAEEERSTMQQRMEWTHQQEEKEDWGVSRSILRVASCVSPSLWEHRIEKGTVASSRFATAAAKGVMLKGNSAAP